MKKSPPGQGRRASKKKVVAGYGGGIERAVGSHFYPEAYPPVPVSDRYCADFYPCTDHTVVTESTFEHLTTGGTAPVVQRGAMAVGHSNPHFAAAMYISSDNSDQQDDYAQSGTLFLERVATQTPPLGSIAEMKLHTMTMEVNCYNNKITDGGFLIFGLIPETEGHEAGATGEENSYLGNTSARTFSIQQLLLLKGTRQVPISKLIGNPIKIIGHALSPAAEKMKDPNSMTITMLSQRQLTIMDGLRDMKRVKPEILAAYLEYKRNPKKEKLPDESAPTEVGYWLVDDFMVPFCVFIPDGTTGALIKPPRIRISRSWLATREVTKVSPSAFRLPGDFTEVPFMLAEPILDRMNEATRTMLNKLSRDMSIVPAGTDQSSTAKLVQELCHIGNKGLDWARSKEGKETLKLATQVLGYGASAALKAAVL